MRTVVLTTLLISLAIAHSLAAADAPTAPIALAVFDFELEDGSAAAAAAGDPAADDGYMKSVSTEVRRVIEQSGRYRLVDVSRADAQAVKTHSLRKCNGCDAGIAAALGAEQSLTGVVRRITRTEYVVSFRLSDAKTGATLAFKETDLRMGANYSWSRGAARLIKDELLAAPR
jgi:Protein of unknown function (DUF2380)